MSWSSLECQSSPPTGSLNVQAVARVRDLETWVEHLLAEGTELFEKHSQKEELVAQASLVLCGC